MRTFIKLVFIFLLGGFWVPKVVASEKPIQKEKEFESLYASYKKGDLHVIPKLAYRYFKGEGCSKDDDKAVALCDKIYNEYEKDQNFFKNNKFSCNDFNNIVDIYYSLSRQNKYFFSKLEKKAFHILNVASEQGNLGLKLRLAHFYNQSIGCKKNLSERFKILTTIHNKIFEDEALLEEDPTLIEATVQLADCYGTVKGYFADLRKAKDLYRFAYHRGNLVGAFNFGAYLLNGYGCVKNPKLAFQILNKAYFKQEKKGFRDVEDKIKFLKLLMQCTKKMYDNEVYEKERWIKNFDYKGK